MKKKSLTLLLVFILFVSCKKEKNNNAADDSPSSQISFKALNLTLGTLQYNNPIPLDLDNDGKAEFNFTSLLIMENDLPYLYLKIRGMVGTGIIVKDEPEMAIGGYWAYPLNADTEISEAAVFNSKWNEPLSGGYFIGIMDNGSSKIYSGEWLGRRDKYLGLKFKIDKEFHYGWLRVSHSEGEDKVTLMDFAYNKEAGKGIKAGQK